MAQPLLLPKGRLEPQRRNEAALVALLSLLPLSPSPLPSSPDTTALALLGEAGLAGQQPDQEGAFVE